MLRKTQSHGRIGEAAVTAKCWMHGIPAHNTAGLRANFAGSDLIVDTSHPGRKLLIQVKTGYNPANAIYLTQCSGENELVQDKFSADFVVFVNIDRKIANHNHLGELDFRHLRFFVVPRADANMIYKRAVNRDYEKPLRSGGVRKLGNMAVNVSEEEMAPYKDAWDKIRDVCGRSA